MTLSAKQLLAQCEANQKRLNYADAIQARGGLLVIDQQQRISHVSTNIDLFLVHPAEYWLGKPLSALDWIAAADLDALAEKPGSSTDLQGPKHSSGQTINARLIHTEKSILIEFEYQSEQSAKEFLARYPFMSFPKVESEVSGHNQRYLDQFREMSGFDRVMIYRFAEDWSGEVIAASSNPEFGDYLGLRFPASDIPPMMRHLYLINPYRLITEVQAPAVPLLSFNDQPADLSRSDLRRVAPIHVNYLTNMGVQASFSIPILINHKLWGLTTCHHRQPLALSPLMRNHCVELARNHTIGLAYYLSNTHLQMVDGISRRITKLLEALYNDSDMLSALNQMGGELTDIMNSNGVVIIQSRHVTAYGLTPSAAGIALIDEWFITQNEHQYNTENLQELFTNQASDFPVSSGLFAIKIYSGGGGWVRFYWFRTQEISEISWAGNPHEPIRFNAETAELSPRHSFEQWIEKKIGHSRPWSTDEKMTGSKFRQTLQSWLG